MGRTAAVADPPATEPAKPDLYAFPVSALTAAAVVLDLAGAGTDNSGVKKPQPWQKQAWDYYDLVGELHYSAGFYGSCLSQVRLTVAIREDDGSISTAFGDEIVEVDEKTGQEVVVGRVPLHPLAGEAAVQVGRLRSALGGQPMLMRAFGLNLSIAGECHLWGHDTTGARRYEVLSTEELRKGEDGKLRRVDDETSTADGDEISDDDLLVRVWRPHPRYGRKADSSVRPLLEVLEELVLLTRAVRATTVSRLAGAGLMLIANEIVDRYGQQSDDDTKPPESGYNRFVRDFITYTTAAISDRGSAAAATPFVLTTDLDNIEKGVRVVDFRSNFDGYPSIALRDEAVQRFAQGTDLPVEIVTGQGGTNHWSAWQIDENAFKAHIEPLLLVIVDALTIGFLWPALKAANSTLTDEDLRKLVVWYDANELVVHPNRGQVATEGYKLWLIGGRVWRREAGFSEDDAPDDDEIAERMARGEVPPGSGLVPVVDAPEQGADEVEPGPPDEPDASARRDVAYLAFLDRVSAAMDATIERAVDRLGARIRSKANGQQAVHDAIRGIDNSLVARTLGPSMTQQLLGGRPFDDGDWQALARLVVRWAGEAGIEAPEAYAADVCAAADEIARCRMFTDASIDPDRLRSMLGADRRDTADAGRV